MKQDFYTIQEASAILGVSPKTLRRWEETGKIKPIRTFGNQRRYSLIDIKKLDRLIHLRKTRLAALQARKVTESVSFSNLSSTAFMPSTPRTSEVTSEPVITTVPSPVSPINQQQVQSFGKQLRLPMAGFVCAILVLFGLLTLWQTVSHHGASSAGNGMHAAMNRDQEVLGDTTQAPAYVLQVAIPGLFGKEVTFLDNVSIKKALTVAGLSTLSGGITTNNANVNAGKGKVTASNILYSILPGSNITISGNKQNPTISANSAVSSVQGQTGDVTFADGTGISLDGLTINNTGVTSLQGTTGDVTLTGGDGISLSGTTITNTDLGSAQDIFKNITAGGTTITAAQNDDTINFAAGSGITLSGDTGSNTITITSNSTGTLSGLTTNGVLYATDATDATSTTPGATGTVLHGITNGAPVFSAVDLTADVTNVLPTGNGGTGTGTTAANGEILIGNGSGYTVSTITQGTGIGVANGSGTITLSNNGVLSLTGTADQVNVSGATGAITVSLPQDIAQTSTPSFTSLNLTGTSNQLVLGITNTATITTASLTNNRIYTFPDGSGTVCLVELNNCPTGGGGDIGGGGGQYYVPVFTGAEAIGNSDIYDNGKVGIGTTSPQGLFSVSGGEAGQALVNLNNTNEQDILVGSSSGTTRFVFDANGDLNIIGGSYEIGGANVLTTSTLGSNVINSSLTSVGALLGGSIATGFGTILTGNTIQGTDITATGTTGYTASGTGAGLTFSGINNHIISASSGTLELGAVTLTNAVTGNNQDITGLNNLSAGGGITFSGLNSALGLVYTSGSNGVLSQITPTGGSECLESNAGDNALAWTSCNNLGTNFWQQSAGALAPLSITNDLLLGSTATNSAAFAFINVGTGTPTASISANVGNNDLYITGSGTLATTNGQTLTLGSASTGNIAVYGLGTGVVQSSGNVLSSSALNLAGGSSYISGILPVANGGTGANLTLSSLNANGSIPYFNNLGVMTTLAIGGMGDCLTSNGSIPTWGSCSGGGGPSTNYFQLINGALSPVQLSDDLLLGATATNSAAFAFINVGSGTPTASISANLGNNAAYLTGLGVLGTTNGQTLSLGNLSTGNVSLVPGGTTALTAIPNGNVGIGTANPQYQLDVQGSNGDLNLGGKSISFGGSQRIFDSGSNETTISPQNGLLTLYDGTNNEALKIYGSDGSTNLELNAVSNSYTLLTSSGTLPLTLQAYGGNVGINTTNPLATLQVNGMYGGNAAEIVNQFNSGDIFDASSSGTTKFVITNSGNVGIGTTNPSNTFAVQSSPSTQEAIVNLYGSTCVSCYDYGVLDVTSAGGAVAAGQERPLLLQPAGQTFGTVGIGVGGNDPLATFDVRGNSNSTSVATISGNTSSSALVVDNSGSGALFSANSSGLNRFTITQNGNVGIGTNTPGSNSTFSGTVLELDSSTNPEIGLLSSANNAPQIFLGANGTYGSEIAYNVGTANALTFSVGGTGPSNEHFSMNQYGQVGLGFGSGLNGATLLGTLDLRAASGTLAIASVSGATTNAGLIVDNSGVGDLFTASKSGATKFTILNNGNISLNNYNNCGMLTTTGTVLTCSSAPAAGTNYWQSNSGAISPANITNDLLLGGTSTASALFAFTGNAGGTPTASISANNGNNATYLTGNGILGTTNSQTLMIGSATTGQVQIGSAPPSTFGNSRIGTAGGSDNNLLLAQEFTTPVGVSGTITSMSVYIHSAISGGSKIQMAIYSDTTSGCALSAADCPNSLIASTAQVTPSGNSWNTIPINTTLSSNTTYWLVYWTSDASLSEEALVNPSHAGNYLEFGSGSFGSLPATFPTITFHQNTYDASIYASFSQSPGSAMTIDPNTGNITLGYNESLYTSGTSSFISNTQGYTDSEVFGANAQTFGQNSTVLGEQAQATDNYATAIGNLASANVAGVAIGYDAQVTGATNGGGNAIGYEAAATSFAEAMGQQANASNTDSIALGYEATTNASNQLVIGGSQSNGSYITDTYLGSGVTDTSPQNTTIHATGGSGSNVGGATLFLAGGAATGNAAGGSIEFETSVVGSSGSTLQSLTPQMVINSNGNVGIGTPNTTYALTINRTTAQANVELNNNSNVQTTLTFSDNTNNGDFDIYRPANLRDLRFYNYQTQADQLTLASGTGFTGINMDTPAAIFDLRGVGNVTLNGTVPVASISGNTTYSGLVVDNSGTGSIFTASNSGQTRFVITNGGNVGIGTSTPFDGATSLSGLQIGALGFGSNTQSLLIGDYNTANGYGGPQITGNWNGTGVWGLGIGNSASNTYTLRLGSVSPNTTGLWSSGQDNIKLMIGGNTQNSTALATLDLRADSASLPIASFSGATNFAGLVVDNSGLGDLFTASKSGASKFSVLNNGNIQINNYTQNDGILYTTATGTVAQASTGSTGQVLQLVGTTPTWVSAGTAGVTQWQLNNNGTISQYNLTNDLLLGGTSTASADFAFTGLGTKTPVASIAAVDNGGNNNGISLNASTGTIQSLQNQTLTIGGTTTGDISFQPGGKALGTSLYLASSGNVGIGTTTSNANLQVAGNTYLGTNILTANDQNDVCFFSNSSCTAGQSGAFQNSLKIFGGSSHTSNIQIFEQASNNEAFITQSGNGALAIQSSSGTTAADIFLLPSQATQGLLGVNTTSPLASMDIRANTGTLAIASVSGNTSFAGLVVDNSGSGDLFTASSSGLTRFVVTQNGNVGIGTSTPANKLEVNGNINILGSNNLEFGGTQALTVTGSITELLNTGNEVSLYSPNVAIQSGGASGGNTTFSIGDTGAAEFNSYTSNQTNAFLLENLSGTAYFDGDSVNGRIGIGGLTSTTNNNLTAALDVRDSSATTPSASISGATTFAEAVIDQSGSGDIFTASKSGATKFVITNAGNVGIGTTTSGGMLSVASANTGNVTGGVTTWANSFSVFGPNAGSTIGAALALGYDTTDGTAVIDSGTPGSSWSSLELISSTFSVFSNGIQGLYQNGSGSVGIGTTTPLAALDVRGNVATAPAASVSATSTYAALDVNQNGSGDIFTASKSGATKFVVKNTGQVLVGGGLASDIDTLTGTSLTIAGSTATSLSLGNTSHATTLNGSTISLVSGAVFNTNDNSILYTNLSGNIQAETTTISGLCLVSQTTPSAPSWATCPSGASSNYWQLNAGAIAPFSTTADLLLGGTATTSADFAFTGVDSTTPIASISAINYGGTVRNGNGNGIVLNASTGTIQSLQNQTLTLGGTTTGDISFSPGGQGVGNSLYLASNGNVGIGTAAPSTAADIAINNSTTNTMSLLLEQAGSGDTGLELKSAITSFYVGLNASNNSTFSINSLLSAESNSIIGENFTTVAPNYVDNNTNEAQATQFTANTTGTISSINVAFDTRVNGSSTYSVAIYSDNSGVPGTLLGKHTGTATVTTANPGGINWNTLSLDSPVSLTSGTKYWLAFQTNDASTYKALISGGSSNYRSGITPGTWANWTSMGSNNGASSDIQGIYATINGGVGDIFLGSLFQLSQTGQLTLHNQADSTSAVAIENADSNNLFVADTADMGIGIGTGTNSLLGTLDLRGQQWSLPVASISGSTVKAAEIVDQSGSGDLFTASKSGATKFVITNSGNVGIGTTAPGSPLTITANPPNVANGSIENIFGNYTSTSNNQAGIYVDPTYISASATSQSYIGGYFNPGSNGSSVTTAKLIGVDGTDDYYGTNTVGTEEGGYFQNQLTAAGIVSNSYGVYIDNPINTGGAITTNTGLYVAAQSAGSTNYAAVFAGGNVGIGTTTPVAALDVRGNVATAPAASVSATSTYAAMEVNQNGSGDLFTASKSGATKFTILNSGVVVVGNNTNGIQFDPTASATCAGQSFFSVYCGTARPTGKIVLSPEYAGATLTASNSASIDGFMTSDASTSAQDSQSFRTYYMWTSTQTSLNNYTIAVRVTLPANFAGWATNNAMTIDLNTQLTTSPDNNLTVTVYNHNFSDSVPVLYDQNETSSSQNTWKTIDYSSSQLSNWSSSGQTATIFLKLNAMNSNYVQVGDIVLNYLQAY